MQTLPDRIDSLDQSLPLTEQQNPRSRGLDQLPVEEIVDLMHQEDYEVLKAVALAKPAIAATVRRIVTAFEQGGRLFYLGAGTSGRLGVLDATECPPTYRADPEMVQGLIAGGRKALEQAVEGAEDSTTSPIEDLTERQLRPNDIVVGIAASGHTPYVRAGLRHAKSIGCQTALIACNQIPSDDSAIDEYILMPVGPEIVSGSTRLKAGTATKLALNMLSTISMVQLGKVYDNLMVDMQISNQKLQLRAQRIVSQLTGLSADAADTLLAAARGEVKTALMMHKGGLDYDEANLHLSQAKGHLRRALEQTDTGHDPA
ncbi:MAG: N-acetylmuramic acid 6-phosphate etherase [Candidatus Melainabacteria bacterium HGW-Melainabacteria-1]|nr:MAG: N-acetylmuramic acid 6-phosphate etherase [Candidatus Melainabacteria bacterium HGW-Melainabacteria-1]